MCSRILATKSNAFWVQIAQVFAIKISDICLELGSWKRSIGIPERDFYVNSQKDIHMYLAIKIHYQTKSCAYRV